jgi:UDP-N-acetylmuramate--alanine ligase
VAEGVDLSEPRRVHIVGIGGAAMSAIATILSSMGHTVTGSDVQPSPTVDRLRADGIDVGVPHDAAHVGQVDALTMSTAIADDNPEVVVARERGIPVLSRAQMLAALAASKRTIAIAGTHGKTTTSAMVASVLHHAGLDPAYLIGADVPSLGGAAAWGAGEWFVVEADESDGTFLELGAEAAVVTNVEPDHLEHWGGFDNLIHAFARFLSSAKGPRVVCADDPLASALASEHGATTYGTAEGATYRMTDLESDRDGARFSLVNEDREVGRFSVGVPGAHNARNAAAAAVTGLLLGVPLAACQEALAGFTGAARRFERRGEVAGVTFVDSYDHLPTEVAAVLAAARAGGWRRVVCTFQPHRYSRIGALWRSFADAFVDTDLLVVTDIYAAHEAPRPGVTGKLIVDAVLDAHPRAAVAYMPSLDDVVAYLGSVLRPGDLCLTLGAGDLTTIPPRVQEALAR